MSLDRVPPTDDVEVPAADALEQSLDAAAPALDPEAAEEDLVAVPAEADPADAVEQHLAVEGDDDERR